MRALLRVIAAFAGLAIAAPAASAAQQGLIAPPSACPNQSDPGAPLAVQAQAMRCMTNFAREGKGQSPLTVAPALDRAARGKSGDILRCDEFGHEACGRDFTHWFEQVGYAGSRCSAFGENIAWGTGSLGTVRSIFSAWIRSPGHRANILGAFADLGVGLRIGALEGNPGAHVWTQEFGSRRC
ncbi:MAG: CAP domain-containing protein [Thermoleophilia bacterium]|nr:CAP domain-containing protein [Thermoleophilia bacterium]